MRGKPDGHREEIRLIIEGGTNLERTLGMMEVLEEREPQASVRGVLETLGGCLPSGTRKDILGATFKQISYICHLGDFDEEEAHLFCILVEEVGGMDSWQASYLIDALKNR